MIIGTSGWQYASWRGRFYPRDIQQRSWLEHYAARFACVEVNNTFYNLPSSETFTARVRDAVRFAGHARRAGWATSRVPSLAEAVVR